MNATHAWTQMCQRLNADVHRYLYIDERRGLTRKFARLRAVLAHQGLQAIALHRLGHLLYSWEARGLAHRTLRMTLKILYPILSRLNDVLNGIWISPLADIGPGLFIAHYGATVIGEVKIGDNCNIGNSVSLGLSGRGPRAGRPTIGDRVVISPGARVFGRVSVGNDAHIGSNSLVTKDAWAQSVVAFDLEGSVGQDARRANDVDVGRS